MSFFFKGRGNDLETVAISAICYLFLSNNSCCTRVMHILKRKKHNYYLIILFPYIMLASYTRSVYIRPVS